MKLPESFGNVVGEQGPGLHLSSAAILSLAGLLATRETKESIL